MMSHIFAYTQPGTMPFDATFWSDAPSAALSNTLVNNMSNEELLAQIFMFGCAGEEPSELFYRWIERGLGGIKIFGWNTENTTVLVKSIAALQKKTQSLRFQIPLFVATDQEGGWVRHVKGETSITPGNFAIGASGYPMDAWYSGYYICKEIAALGINMNFAPSIDLFTDHQSSIIGTRSFGENPDNVGVLGAAFIAGSIAAGVIPTAKHFPGHGGTNDDSHTSLPSINIDMNTWMNREVIPFKYIIAAKCPAIMSGHLSFPYINPNGEPASLSKKFLTNILREQLGYDGLIITDDMMMNGGTSFAGSLSNAFRLAIEAGNDIIISSSTAKLGEALWVNNLALMGTNKDFREQVKSAAFRVIKAKLDYFKEKNHAPLYPDEKDISTKVPDRAGQSFFLEQACRAVTVYKKGALFPLKPESAGKVLFCGSMQEFFDAGKRQYPNSSRFQFSEAMGPKEAQWMYDNIMNTAIDFDTIVFCVSNKNDMMTATRLKSSGKRVVILSTMSPVDSFDADSWVDTILLGYSQSPYTFEALIGALKGEFVPRGSLPITK